MTKNINGTKTAKMACFWFLVAAAGVFVFFSIASFMLVLGPIILQNFDKNTMLLLA